jgi:hypothetical protein
VSVLNPATSAYEPVMYEMKKTKNDATAYVLDWRAASPDNFTKPQFRPSGMRVAGKAPWDAGTPGDTAAGLANRPVLLAIKDAGAGDGSVFLSSCDFASECPLPTCDGTAVIWEEEWQFDFRAKCPDREDHDDTTVCSPDNGAGVCAWAGLAGNGVNGCASGIEFERSPPELRKELIPTTVPGCPSPYCPISAQMKARASWIPEETAGAFTFKNKYRNTMFLALLEDNGGPNGYVGGSPGSIQLRYVGSKFKFTEVLAPAGVAAAPTPPTAAPTAAPAAAPTPPTRAPTPTPTFRPRTPKLVVRTKLTGFTVATFTRGIRFAYRRAFAHRYNIADVLRVIITNIRGGGGSARRRLGGSADELGGRALATAAAAAVEFDIQVASNTTADATALNAEVKGGDAAEEAALVAKFKTEIGAVAASGEYPQDVPANYVVPAAVAVATEVGELALETGAPTPAPAATDTGAPTPAPTSGGGGASLPIPAIAGAAAVVAVIAAVAVRRAKLSSTAAAARPSCSDGDVQLTDIYPGAQVLGGPDDSDKGGATGVL